MEYREISDSKITCGGTLFLSGLGFFMSYLLHFLPIDEDYWLVGKRFKLSF